MEAFVTIKMEDLRQYKLDLQELKDKKVSEEERPKKGLRGEEYRRREQQQ